LRSLSLIPAVGDLPENPLARRIAIAALTLIFLGLAAGVYYTVGGRAIAEAAMPAAGAAAPAGNQAAPAAKPLDAMWALVGGLVASWLLATAVVTLVGKRALAESKIALREGVLWPLFITALVMAGLALF